MFFHAVEWNRFGSDWYERHKGTICDESGEPIIGASVIVKGTSNGTISDLDGKFTLSVSDKAVIEISFVGYETQEIKNEYVKNGF